MPPRGHAGRMPRQRPTKVNLKATGKAFKPPVRHRVPKPIPQKAAVPEPTHAPPPPGASSGSKAQPNAQDDDPVRTLIEKEQKVLADLASLEERIYEYETSYLSTSGRGNAVRGYADWLSGNAPISGEIRNEDRIFSRSSATGWSHLGLLPAEEDA